MAAFNPQRFKEVFLSELEENLEEEIPVTPEDFDDIEAMLKNLEQKRTIRGQ